MLLSCLSQYVKELFEMLTYLLMNFTIHNSYLIISISICGYNGIEPLSSLIFQLGCSAFELLILKCHYNYTFVIGIMWRITESNR